MTDIVRYPFCCDGRLPDDAIRTVDAALSKLHYKRLVLILQENVRYSSDPQRAYYFAVIVEKLSKRFTELTGDYWHPEKDTHPWLMIHVGNLIEERMGPDGKPDRKRRSYMKLTRAECEEYHMKCRAFGARYGCDIPEPNESVTNYNQLKNGIAGF